MMGRAHALSGVAAWLAGAPAVAASTDWFTLTPATWAVGAVICAGAALAPDLDHPGHSSASNSLGKATTGLSHVVALVSFGHRKATHSLLGIAAFAGLMLLATGPLAPWGVLVSAFLLTAFAGKALGVGGIKRVPGTFGSFNLVVSAAAVTAAVWYFSDGDFGWFLWAAAAGFFIHVCGDFITYAGVPWLWPLFGDLKFSQMRAGGATEKMILTPVFLLIVAWCIGSFVLQGTVFGHPVGDGRGGLSVVNSPAQPDSDGSGKPSKKAKKQPAQSSAAAD